jgi:hypothetical protein
MNPFLNTLPGFSGKSAHQNFQTRDQQEYGKSPWRVLTSSLIIQKRRLKATYRKNNAKKMFHNPDFQTQAVRMKVMRVTAVNNVRNTIV